MGSIFSSCANPKIPSLNIFSSSEFKTIEINTSPPSSILTMNKQIGLVKNKLTIHDFHILKVLGSGNFGQVYYARLKGTSKCYAIKAIPKKLLRNEYLMNSILKERQILLKSNHKFILKLRYSFQDNFHFYLVMDYMKGGPISAYIENEGKNGFNEDIVRYYAAQVILALECLHEQMSVVYRDLKPDNILLDELGNIKISDFGISQGSLKSWKREIQNDLWDSSLSCPRNHKK